MTTISQILQEFEEIMFDYHIRGCRLADRESNKICDESKKEVLNSLRQKLTELLKVSHGQGYKPPEGYSVPKEIAFALYNIVASDKPNHQKVDSIGALINKNYEFLQDSKERVLQ